MKDENIDIRVCMKCYMLDEIDRLREEASHMTIREGLIKLAEINQAMQGMVSVTDRILERMHQMYDEDFDDELSDEGTEDDDWEDE